MKWCDEAVVSVSVWDVIGRGSVFTLFKTMGTPMTDARIALGRAYEVKGEMNAQGSFIAKV